MAKAFHKDGVIQYISYRNPRSRYLAKSADILLLEDDVILKRIWRLVWGSLRKPGYPSPTICCIIWLRPVPILKWRCVAWSITWLQIDLIVDLFCKSSIFKTSFFPGSRQPSSIVTDIQYIWDNNNIKDRANLTLPLMLLLSGRYTYYLNLRGIKVFQNLGSRSKVRRSVDWKRSVHEVREYFDSRDNAAIDS